MLRSEIGEVANKRAWFDSQGLTPEILRLYKAPLRVQGWDAGLVEVHTSSLYCSPHDNQFVSK